MAEFSFRVMLLIILAFMPLSLAATAISPTIQIHTQLKNMVSASSWLIIIYDADSPAVYPYLFDLLNLTENFTIFTNTKNYRMISILNFDLLNKKINNFCQIPQTIFSNESIDIRLTGTLTPNPMTSQCRIRRIQ